MRIGRGAIAVVSGVLAVFGGVVLIVAVVTAEQVLAVCTAVKATLSRRA